MLSETVNPTRCAVLQEDAICRWRRRRAGTRFGGIGMRSRVAGVVSAWQLLIF